MSDSPPHDAPRPVVGASVVIVDGERVLLVRRGQPPNQGLWSLPGGKIEWRETVREAARREALEETGLEVELGPLLGVVDRMGEADASFPAYHFVVLRFLARPVGGRLTPGDDAAEVRWVTRDDWAALPTTLGLGDILDEALRLAATQSVWETRDAE